MNRCAPCCLVWGSFLMLIILIVSFIVSPSDLHVLMLFLHRNNETCIPLLSCFAVMLCVCVCVYFLPPYGYQVPRRWLLHQHHMAGPTRQAALCKTHSVSTLHVFSEGSAALVIEGLITVYRKHRHKRRRLAQTRMFTDSLDNRWYIHLLLGL